MIVAYASRTGTLRNLSGLRRYLWRLMVSALGVLQHEGFPYALDNGAWTTFKRWKAGKRPTPDPCLRSFAKAVTLLGAGADFIVVPDVVEGGDRSWAMTRFWLRRLRRDRRLRGVRLLIAVQDGYELDRVAPYLSKRVGVFVGGSTEWKLATMDSWAKLARSKGAWCHVGRVNTVRRIHLCEHAKAHSFDGSGASRFAKILQRLENGRRQGSFLADMERPAYDRVWRWRVNLPERHGQRCRLIARGTMNSALIEFEDGVKHVVSRYAFRKIAPAPPPE